MFRMIAVVTVGIAGILVPSHITSQKGPTLASVQAEVAQLRSQLAAQQRSIAAFEKSTVALIQSTPSSTITSRFDKFEVCLSDALALGLNSSFGYFVQQAGSCTSD